MRPSSSPAAARHRPGDVALRDVPVCLRPRSSMQTMGLVVAAHDHVASGRVELRLEPGHLGRDQEVASPPVRPAPREPARFAPISKPAFSNRSWSGSRKRSITMSGSRAWLSTTALSSHSSTSAVRAFPRSRCEAWRRTRRPRSATSRELRRRLRGRDHDPGSGDHRAGGSSIRLTSARARQSAGSPYPHRRSSAACQWNVCHPTAFRAPSRTLGSGGRAHPAPPRRRL